MALSRLYYNWLRVVRGNLAALLSVLIVDSTASPSPARATVLPDLVLEDELDQPEEQERRKSTISVLPSDSGSLSPWTLSCRLSPAMNMSNVRTQPWWRVANRKFIRDRYIGDVHLHGNHPWTTCERADGRDPPHAAKMRGRNIRESRFKLLNVRKQKVPE